MKNDPRQPKTLKMVKITRALFFINAAVWLTFGILSFFRAAATDNGGRWIITILMLINAGVMAGLGVVLVNQYKWLYFFAILYVAVNVILSVTDQVGVIDVLILLLNLVLLGTLIVTRRRIDRVSAL